MKCTGLPTRASECFTNTARCGFSPKASGFRLFTADHYLRNRRRGGESSALCMDSGADDRLKPFFNNTKQLRTTWACTAPTRDWPPSIQEVIRDRICRVQAFETTCSSVATASMGTTRQRTAAGWATPTAPTYPGSPCTAGDSEDRKCKLAWGAEEVEWGKKNKNKQQQQLWRHYLLLFTDFSN